MVVISHSINGAYHLAEVDGSVSKLKFAVFHLIPYHPRSPSTLEVMQFINVDQITGLPE
jgi:hypothetical protein